MSVVGAKKHQKSDSFRLAPEDIKKSPEPLFSKASGK